MKLFNVSILSLEKESINSTHVYDIMSTLRIKLSNRLEHKFFGSDINEKMTKLSLNRKIEFEKACLNSYRKALSYLEKWFNFDNSIFKNFKSLNLDKT
jgi:hypothetical protein